MLGGREPQQQDVAGADRNAPQRNRGMIGTAMRCAVHEVYMLNSGRRRKIGVI